MADNLAPSFADLLSADSESVMPTSDKDVQAALASFGAVFRKTNSPAHIVARAELLAGLASLHPHHLNSPSLLAALTTAQQQTSAAALDLDPQAFGADASWPSPLARRIVSKKAPGLAQ